MVGEEVEVFLKVSERGFDQGNICPSFEKIEIMSLCINSPVKRGKQTVCVLLLLHLDESPTEVFNGLGHAAVLVNRVVDFVF